MSTALITGAGGLVGSEAARHFHALGWEVVGIDNDLRKRFFGEEASTAWMTDHLRRSLPRYRHRSIDIRDGDALVRVLDEIGGDLELVIHAAAQPSHDWSAYDPMTDFGINAFGTLTLLEAVRRHKPDATFIFTSTNKVYGDVPNRLPLIEEERRWEVPAEHEWHAGIPERMSIDQSTHSPFGVSKAAADLLVQEYGRYFGMRTTVFRGGCLTGPGHSGAEMHGFLAYLMKCTATGRPYKVYGHLGKQVRDNIHCADLVAAFEHVARMPRTGEVYNMGGGRAVNCSMLEAIALCQEVARRRLDWTYVDASRIGDHAWWISDVSRFESHYPGWRVTRFLRDILEEIHDANRQRWEAAA